MLIEQSADLRQGADGGDSARGHDGQMIRELLQGFQLMTGDKQTFAGTGQFLKELDRFPPADRVNAA